MLSVYFFWHNLHCLFVLLFSAGGENRPLPPNLTPGKPNLIVCPQGKQIFIAVWQIEKSKWGITIFCANPIYFAIISADLLKMLLSLYVQNVNQPLPSPKEVLLCDQSTSAEQVRNSILLDLASVILPPASEGWEIGQRHPPPLPLPRQDGGYCRPHPNTRTSIGLSYH